ncbi:MAG TPA: DUF4843 domain-containing protein [Parasegetibacter sp.]|jgi:uncharacterized protein YcfL
MRKIIFFALTLLVLQSCRKNSPFLYNDKPSIYFAGDVDMDVTFSKYKTNELVLYIPIEIGGYSSSSDREVAFEVVADSTTAVEGLHYAKLPAKFIMTADSFRVHVPVTIYNNDVRLKSEKFRLYLRLVPNNNFISGIYYKQELSIYISDILLKPKIWDSKYSTFFGVYSEAKHRKILEICDIPEIPDVYDGGPYNYKWDAFGRAVNNYYRDNYPQYDENGQVINPWM